MYHKSDKRFISLVALAALALICGTIIYIFTIVTEMRGEANSAKSHMDVSKKEDKSYREMLIGTWEATLHNSKESVKIEMTYRNDGTWKSSMIPANPKRLINDKFENIEFSGIWELKNRNELFSIVTSSENPNFIKPGATETNVIINISANEITMESSGGNQEKLYRK